MKNVNSNGLCDLVTKIVLLGFFNLSTALIKPCFAQSNITPDNTLGAEGSQVIPNVNNPDGIPSELIEAGAQRGQNLFHSFQEFNVSEGRGAYFVVPNNTIQNVLTRVTGSNASSINGVLGTISSRNFDPSNVNLFLINPNGIIFGRNASLNINGSFAVTTANAIEFGNRGLFSATGPQLPSELLTVNPSAFLFNRINAQASIQSTSVAPAGEDILGNSLTGLRVGDGNSLLLLGGNINIDGQEEQGGISAVGGRVELGGLASIGTVGLNVDGNNLSLSFPEQGNGSDVSLNSGARVNLRADGGGDSIINSGNLEIIEGSQILAGISSGLGSPGVQAGNIAINATGTIVIDGVPNGSRSGVFNQTEIGSVGNSGSIDINADSVEIKNGGQLNTSALGSGNSGKILINATNKVLFDGAPLGFQSSAFSQLGENAVGNSGGIEINAGSVEVFDGGYLEANTLGIGNAGKIQITAREKVVIDGESPLGFLSAVFSQVGENAVGNSGGIEINAGNVEVTNGGQLSANTLGTGDAGKITISARDKVVFDDQSPFGKLSSAFSQVRENAVGNSGGIEINANNVEVTNGGQLSATTLNRGNAGLIKINATDKVVFDGVSRFGNLSSAISQVKENAEGDSEGIEINGSNVEITGGAQLTATTLGKGDSGKISITGTERVVFDGESTPLFTVSSAISQVFGGAEGDSGGIEINGGSVEITGGAQLTATTLGKGNSGKISITGTERVVFDGESTFGFGPVSSAISQVKENAEGDSGGIEINGGNVEIRNGSQLTATTLGKGDSGLIRIAATERVVFDGESTFDFGPVSSAISQVFGGAEGNSGGIEIEADNVEITNGAFLDASTLGKGNAGAVRITGRDRVIFDGKSKDGSLSSNSSSQVGSGAIGNSEGISINAPNIKLSNTGFISTKTLGDGRAGDITVRSTNFDIIGGSQVSAESEGTDVAGNINISVKDNFNANNGQVLTQAEKSSGGDINITAGKNIILRNNSDIKTILSTTTGSGGDINLNANAIVALEDSDIFAFAPQGSGGDIIFNTNAFLSDSLFSPTSETGNSFTEEKLNRLDGNSRVDVNASGSVSSGTIIGITDNSFLQDDLAELTENPIDSEALVASSCVVRSKKRNGSFFITGTAGLPYRPGDTLPSRYSAIKVRTIEESSAKKPNQKWKIGDPIVEPTGVYSLENGRRILSRECGK
ncbi:two-partner secretion domain-containing protein [Mastigocoleus testarum]|uniref:Filamentous haemagglutinin FhaB/tRNA nuclease CdiA-like TPS domain-containing protein n=1 Tax=Mastigocoleus testarum BC008 TaxID=371196 RepID=A0A0V7ZZS4_9CYAN|nr:filamentous hemagglutinin N-terminal domain-containing protein [Mastigocoleus testarum]KST70052.1 hypothetical protein BC008_06315 [Mastigocoleus testarum BC008]